MLTQILDFYFFFKGVDPFSLDMLAKEGIVALRRAKRRNMERYVIDHEYNISLHQTIKQMSHSHWELCVS